MSYEKMTLNFYFRNSTNRKSRSKCFKLNNNCLPDVKEIKIVAAELFENVDDIAWLDLSFNELTKIDDVSTISFSWWIG